MVTKRVLYDKGGGEKVDNTRKSGILLHPTSLHSKYGIGSLGDEAYEFVNYLVKAEQKLWQMCPLGPTGYGDSPYQCFSAFAGNHILIDLEKLNEEGLLEKEDLDNLPEFDENRVDYGKVIVEKEKLLWKAFKKFEERYGELERGKFERFCESSSEWLEDYALFMSTKAKYGGRPWCEWDEEIKLREEAAMREYKEKLAGDIKYHKFLQWKFNEQWMLLKAYANSSGVEIIGDIPIYVAFDSADAWSNSELFQFDENKNPTAVAGVPPDYFSKTGQLWGNPLFDWDKLKETDYEWWVKRIENCTKISDIVRIDHFRGFASYWSVEADEETALNGVWKKGPGSDLFYKIRKKLGELPIIAEDLGFITPDVYELKDEFAFPGMKILQFAFDSAEDSTDFYPHMYEKNCLVYTGTHDNDTVVGWYKNSKEEDVKAAEEYLNMRPGDSVNWAFIRTAWASTAMIAIAPMQDILGLGSDSRMNIPGTTQNNWQWRIKKEDLNDGVAAKLRKLTKIYMR